MCVFVWSVYHCPCGCLCVCLLVQQVDEMLSTARSLSEYYRAVQDDRTNRTLYVLTLVTSVFVPAQFLTGLYGTLATIFGTLMILPHCTALSASEHSMRSSNVSVPAHLILCFACALLGSLCLPVLYCATLRCDLYWCPLTVFLLAVLHYDGPTSEFLFLSHQG